MDKDKKILADLTTQMFVLSWQTRENLRKGKDLDKLTSMTLRAVELSIKYFEESMRVLETRKDLYAYIKYLSLLTMRDSERTKKEVESILEQLLRRNNES